ncbi:uncharacterized protein LOC121367659 [Gigantopelta aegis]|uniref:uncharacterized protein LOC121367659 n=1 Tax=Gigantopelta aegis TaxID=1735272 RepID=UPI001B88CEAD|nr:uncharacterized protein LOC121367659 [Gigantopelta aegis]
MNSKMLSIVRVFTLIFLFIDGHLSFDDAASAKYSAFCRRGVVYVGLPWDCSGFIQCIPATGGRFFAVWIPCPRSLQWDNTKKVCVHGKGSCSNLAKVAEEKCPLYPNLKFLHPKNCAMYYNCRQKDAIKGMKKYENECAYPLLFHQEAQECWPKFLVKCGKRPVPATKCDYLLACKAEVCTGKSQGPYPVPGREFGKEYIVCANDTIAEKGICRATDEVFDPIQSKCTNTFEQSITIFCQRNPTKSFEDMNKCSFYFDCSKVEHQPGLKPYQTECKYPDLFDTQDKKCKPYNEVICHNRLEPKQPCDYAIGHCIDRPECLSCDAKCEPTDQGQIAHLGEPSKIITCKDGRTMQISTCPLGKSFDSTTKQCEKACTCGAEVRALALAIMNIQKFLAPKGLPVLACDKPLENILRETKPTTQAGNAVVTCPQDFKKCPTNSSLTCAAGLIFGTWNGSPLQKCIRSKYTAEAQFTSPLDLPCIEGFGGHISITAQVSDLTKTQAVSLDSGSDIVVFKMVFDFAASSIVMSSEVHGVQGIANVIQKKLSVKTNTDFEIKLYFDPDGFRAEIGLTEVFSKIAYDEPPGSAFTLSWSPGLSVQAVSFNY